MSSPRNLAIAIGTVAVALLLWMVNPWVDVPAGLEQIVAVAFWILSIALVVVLYVDARRDAAADEVEIEGPAFARFLFNNSRAGLVWLPIRLFIGFQWIEAGWHKVSGPGWLDGGTALAGFWKAAAAVPQQGKPPITYEWYRDFITFLLNGHHESWFAPLVAFGELAIGLGLIFGALTGIAAFFGAFMNMSFLLAGSASTNPIMFTGAIGLILAWKVAGYYGVDRWLLPRLGTPWRPGSVVAGTAHRPPLRA
ncbi:MAG: DoxX family membrane protein [Chloroflexota bacterium]